MFAKVCTTCTREKSLDDFYKSPTGRLGHHAQCKDCIGLKRTAYLATPGGRLVLLAARLRPYKLTVPAYFAMLESQGWCCAICFTDDPGAKGSWHVDHDHATGRVRGLLCNNCNRGMGVMGDSKETMESAAIYLTTTFEAGVSAGLL